MTRPTVIYFGPDGGPKRDETPRNKVYLRTLLYSTAKRGNILESMHVRLRRGETAQNFNIWVHGDKQYIRGSGLFVPDTGVATAHNFLLPDDGAEFSFLAGHYTIEVFAVAVGSVAKKLFSTELDVSQESAKALSEADAGIYFDWGADTGRYQPHVRSRPQAEFPDFLRDLLPPSEKAP
jgi:hypothetical protein